MKKLLILLLSLSLASIGSCGSSGGNGANGGTHETEAKEIAVSSAYVALASIINCGRVVLSTVLGGIPDYYQPVNTNNPYSSDYSSSLFNGDSDDTISGTYYYTMTGSIETTLTIEFPQANPTTHSSTLASLPSPTFTLPSDSTSYTTTISTADAKPLTGKIYGSATLTGQEGGGASVTAVTGTAYETSVEDLGVTLSDSTTGTASFTNQTITWTLSNNIQSFSVSDMASIVTYEGETYNCTISATRTVPEQNAGGDPTFTISAANCT